MVPIKKLLKLGRTSAAKRTNISLNKLSLYLIVSIAILCSGSVSAVATFDSIAITGSPWSANSLFERKVKTRAARKERGRNVSVESTVKLEFPITNSEIVGNSAEFVWSAEGINAQRWALWVGSRKYANDIYSGLHNDTAASVSDFPADGRVVYVSLYYFSKNRWRFGNEYLFKNIADTAGSPVAVVEPLEVAELVEEVVVDQVEVAEPLEEVVVEQVEVAKPVEEEVVDQVEVAEPVEEVVEQVEVAEPVEEVVEQVEVAEPVEEVVEQVEVAEPVEEVVVEQIEVAEPVEEVVEQVEVAEPPVLVRPANDLINGVSQTFSWASNGTQVDLWELRIGTNSGLEDLYTATLNDTSVTVSDLPQDCSIVFVALYYLQDDIWTMAEELALYSGYEE